MVLAHFRGDTEINVQWRYWWQCPCTPSHVGQELRLHLLPFGLAGIAERSRDVVPRAVTSYGHQVRS